MAPKGAKKAAPAKKSTGKPKEPTAAVVTAPPNTDIVVAAVPKSPTKEKKAKAPSKAKTPKAATKAKSPTKAKKTGVAKKTATKKAPKKETGAKKTAAKKSKPAKKK